MELGIHRKDAINANNIPSGSTSKAIASPGSNSNIFIDGRAPARTEGVIDSTRRNKAPAVIKVTPSRTLGERLVSPTNSAPNNGITRAKAIAVFGFINLYPTAFVLRDEIHQS